MNPQEEQELMEQQQYLQTLQQQMDREQSNLIQKEQLLAQGQSGVMKEQLDLTPELELIEHLLKGEQRVVDENGEVNWIDDKTNSVKILSTLGVQLIMNTLKFYLNKNTLLSNYDEVTILAKMEDFSESLNDTLFMSYEKYFLQPTRKECENQILEKIENLTNDRVFYFELKGINHSREDIKKEIIENMNLEKELEKIRATLQKERLKGFEHLLRKIQDTVHSAYLRAWNGQERRSLRQHMHISESVMPNQQPRNNNPFKRIFG